MFHLRDNFNSGAPISQVPARWFNNVAGFLNGLIGGFGISLKKNTEGASVIEVNEDDLGISKDVGSPSTLGSFPAEVTAKTYTWDRGGNNGVNIHVLAEGEEDGGTHQLYDAVLHFSKDGFLVKITKGTGGVDIGG